MSYKILSLDGGRSWALIQARILQDIYGDIKGHELLKHFDVVIANSGQCFWLFKCQVKFRLAEILFLNKIKENNI